MNIIKRFNLITVLLITAMFFITSSLSAQQREGKGSPPIPDEAQINKMVDVLATELSISEAQKTEILALYTNHFNEVKSSMSSGERPSREEMESLKEEFEDSVKSVLNDEQQDLFDEFMEKNNRQKGKQKSRRN